MDNVKSANGSRNESSIVGSRTRAGKDQREASSAGTKSLQKKAATKAIKSVRPQRKAISSKMKSDKLVCRYCAVTMSGWCWLISRRYGSMLMLLKLC